MLKPLMQIVRSLASLDSKLERIQLAIGRIEARQVRSENSIAESEFGTFSQFGEDGIIQYLISKVPLSSRTFVEFGVENYQESNTRFLLMKDYWTGLVLDSSDANIATVKNSDYYWRHRLAAKSAFISVENINSLLIDNGMRGDIGLLSIDIDGNDYWVWKAIDAVSPRIVIVEYNSVYGPERAVTIPYDPKFERNKAHYSNLYWGSSIAAFALLGQQRGYALVASNRARNNLFFVRKDVLGDLQSQSAAEAWAISSFRESRDSDGALTFLSPKEALTTIASLPLIDVVTSKQIRVADIDRGFLNDSSDPTAGIGVAP